MDNKNKRRASDDDDCDIDADYDNGMSSSSGSDGDNDNDNDMEINSSADVSMSRVKRVITAANVAERVAEVVDTSIETKLSDSSDEQTRKDLAVMGGKIISGNCTVKVLNEGDINRVPMCVSSDGKRAWCRRREPPHNLEYTDLLMSSVKWQSTDASQGVHVGIRGETRCGAKGNFIVFQRHTDGVLCLTNGKDHAFVYLVWAPDKDSVNVLSPEDYASEARPVLCVVKAITVVGNGLGFCAVVEDFGIV